MKKIFPILSFVIVVFLSPSVKGQTPNNFNNLIQFDFSFYESNKGKLLSLNDFNIDSKSSRLESNNTILNKINKELGTNLDFPKDFKELELNSYETIANWIGANKIMDNKEMQIVASFSGYLNKLKLSEAIARLEDDVEKANLSADKVKEFQYLANVVKVIEYQDVGFFSDSVRANGCASALVGLAFASAGLVAACNPPAMGATVGWGCYLAGANFIRASISVGNACGD